MPIIIQNAEVQVVPEDGGPRAGGGNGAQEERSPHVAPLRAADVERVQRFLAARAARVRAD